MVDLYKAVQHIHPQLIPGEDYIYFSRERLEWITELVSEPTKEEIDAALKECIALENLFESYTMIERIQNRIERAEANIPTAIPVFIEFIEAQIVDLNKRLEEYTEKRNEALQAMLELYYNGTEEKKQLLVDRFNSLILRKKS